MNGPATVLRDPQLVATRARLLVAMAVLLLVPVVAPPGAAEAGTFTVRQCGSLLTHGFSGTFSQIGRSEPLIVAQGCRQGGPGRAGLYQDRSGRAVPTGAGGQYLFTTPPEVSLSGITASAALRDASGFRSALVISAEGKEPVRLEEGSASDGQVRNYRWSTRSDLRDQVAARLVCVRGAGCENSANSSKAFLELHGIELEAHDRVDPELVVKSRPGVWTSGAATIDFAASDRGSGLVSARAEINGFPVPLAGAERCVGLRNSMPVNLRPCVSEMTGHELAKVATDRAPFREGRNTHQVCVSDFAQPTSRGNETCSPMRRLNVDNLPPARLEDARTPFGQAWSPRPNFDLFWRLPADSGSPIEELRYEVLNESSAGGNQGQVSSGVWAAGSAESEGSGQVHVPHPGTYRSDLRLRDRAGNLGSRSSVILRFDDRPPPRVDPEPPPVWLSADHFPYDLRLPSVEPGGPSGIGGYAFALSSSDGPTNPCAGTICQPAELDLEGGPGGRSARLDSLPEGQSWFSVVAVSGAGVPSREIGSVPLEVDLSPPVSDLEGLPTGWRRTPVDLRVVASDSLSGMEPESGQATPPATSILASDGQRVESPGNQAEVTISREGETGIEFFARDLAGNVNDGLSGPSGRQHASPGQAQVRIDRTAPRVWLEGIGSQGEPELVRIRVDDALSGVAGGRIVLIPDRGGPETPLPTEIRDGALESRIPSEELPAGRYLVTAEAEDRAGNRTASPDEDGAPVWPVQLPLKERSRISLDYLGQSTDQASLRVGQGKAVPVVGQLGGGPGSGPGEVSIHEQFHAGTVIKSRSREVPVSTDGEFRTSLPAGPSRTIRATWAGSTLRGRAESRPLSLVVRDAVSFSLGPGRILNGSRVFMRGRVKGGALAPSLRNKQVAIEFLDPSRKTWRPVGLVPADTSGSFRFSYRFSTITSTQRIIFRARSLPEAGWPFLASTSLARKVVVMPRRRP